MKCKKKLDEEMKRIINSWLWKGIIKAHYNIVKTRPSNINGGNTNAVAIGPTHAWSIQRCHPSEFIIFFNSSSALSLWAHFSYCIQEKNSMLDKHQCNRMRMLSAEALCSFEHLTNIKLILQGYLFRLISISGILLKVSNVGIFGKRLTAESVSKQ